MGRFLIFIGTLLFLSLIGIGIYWVWNKVYLSIKKNQNDFDIENERNNKINIEIKENKKND